MHVQLPSISGPQVYWLFYLAVTVVFACGFVAFMLRSGKLVDAKAPGRSAVSLILAIVFGLGMIAFIIISSCMGYQLFSEACEHARYGSIAPWLSTPR